MNTPMRKTTLHTRSMPKDLKAQFKSYCAKRGYTMQGAIIALLTQAVMEQKALPGARKNRSAS